MSNDERRHVPLDEAIARLGDAERIHMFCNVGGIPLGAHWDRDEVIAAITQYGVEDSGPTASAMQHTLVLHDGQYWLFIEAAPARERTP